MCAACVGAPLSVSSASGPLVSRRDSSRILAARAAAMVSGASTFDDRQTSPSTATLSRRMSLRICSKRLSKGSSVTKSSPCLTRLTSATNEAHAAGNASRFVWICTDGPREATLLKASTYVSLSVALAALAAAASNIALASSLLMGAGSSSKDAWRHLTHSSRSLVEAQSQTVRSPSFETENASPLFPTWATAMNSRRPAPARMRT